MDLYKLLESYLMDRLFLGDDLCSNVILKTGDTVLYVGIVCLISFCSAIFWCLPIPPNTFTSNFTAHPLI